MLDFSRRKLVHGALKTIKPKLSYLDFWLIVSCIKRTEKKWMWTMTRPMIGLTLQILISLGLCACGQSQNHRQSTRAQSEANTQAALKDLKPAEGHFEGTMQVTKSGHSYDVTLDIQRVFENVRQGQSSDPTQTVQVPKLNGVMRFPVLDKTDISKYSRYNEILAPMGGFSIAIFDFGDFDPDTHLMILPYNVSGYSLGSFGQLHGKLENGTFTGYWFSKPLGNVATFSLKMISGAAPDDNGAAPIPSSDSSSEKGQP